MIHSLCSVFVVKKVKTPNVKFVARRKRALAIIVLLVDPSLLYLLGEPKNSGAVWKKLEDQFQKRTWSNKLALRRRLNNLRLKEE